MDNDNTLPLKSGKLPKECYATWQEFVDDLPKVLQLAQDNKEIIKGAEGKQGPRGTPGSVGPKGPAGLNTTKITLSYTIPTNVTFVEIPMTVGWDGDIYNITYNGHNGPVSPGILPFNPASGYIGIGTVVQRGGLPTPTTIRVYFTFAGGITATPDANFILKITRLS